ncbi:MAG: hypothetical protein ACOC8H_00845, partial [bacterium]
MILIPALTEGDTMDGRRAALATAFLIAVFLGLGAAHPASGQVTVTQATAAGPVVGTNDVDTNRDDLVELGDDLSSFGPDTGTISWQVKRSAPQVYIPLATAQWDQLTVHAYIAQGAFHRVRNTYWKPSGADENGLWQAYSLHTRAKLLYLHIDPEDASKNAKRVTVARPRGNVVVFEFPWDDTAGSFKPYGLPLGVNNKRTYVLRDTTPADNNDLSYHLYFDSGIIHEFDDETGLIEAVSHVDGRRVEVASMAGVSLNPAANTQTSPRYTVTLTWEYGRIKQVKYEDRESDAEITTVLVYDQTGEGRIEGLDKTIGEFSSSVSGTMITYGETAGKQKTVQRTADGSVVTLKTTIPDVGYIEEKVTLNSNGLVTRRSTKGSGGLAGDTTVVTEFAYVCDGDNDPNGGPVTTNRYEANQAAMWGKVAKITTSLDGSWEEFAYWNDGSFKTGWLKQRSSPFKEGQPADTDQKKTIEEYSYDAALSGNGDAADTAYLVERPRQVVTKTAGTETGRVYYKYSGGVTLSKQVRVRGEDWDDEQNLSTTVTRHTYGPSDVIGPTGGATYSVNGDPGTKMQLIAVAKGPNGSDIRTTTSTINAFGYTESSTTVDSGVTIAQATSTMHTYGFGRPKKTTYLSGLFTDNITYGPWGPTDVQATDKSRTKYQYDAIGQVKVETYYPDGECNDSRSIATTYTRDVLGHVTDAATLAKKPNEENIGTTTSAKYDILGRLRSSTNAETRDKSTTVSYAVANGVVTATTTFPDETTKIVNTYIDGRPKSVSGTAALPVEYEYGVDDGNDIGLWTKEKRNNGSDWTCSFQNM